MKTLQSYLHKQIYLEKNNPLLNKFLTERQISDNEIETFGLGFSSFKSLPDFISNNTEHYQGMNVLNENRKLSIMNRLTFPHYDMAGNLSCLSCRKLDNSELPKVLTPTLKDHYKPLFNLQNAKEYIQKWNEVIIVEGQMDCISLYKNGFKNTVAMGSSCLSGFNLIDLLSLTSNFIFAFDNDTAGKKAIIVNFLKMIDKNVSIKVCTDWADCKDPDEFILKYGVDVTARTILSAISITEVIAQVPNIDEILIDNCTAVELIYPTLKLLDRMRFDYDACKVRILKKRIRTFNDAKAYLMLDNDKVNVIDYALALWTANARSLNDKVPDFAWIKNDKADLRKYNEIKGRLK